MPTGGAIMSENRKTIMWFDEVTKEDIPLLAENLVEWGITSVSVSPDMLAQTREIIARVEKRLKIR